MLPGCLVYVWCETKSNPGSELLGLSSDNGPLHLSLESCCACGCEAKTVYFQLSLRGNILLFCYYRGSNIPILSNSLAKCLSSKNYNLSAFWKRIDRWKFTSLQSCVSFDLAPQIGWKLYILLPAMLLHGPEMWGGWPSCSIWLGCQADDLWPQSLHHHCSPIFLDWLVM